MTGGLTTTTAGSRLSRRVLTSLLIVLGLLNVSIAAILVDASYRQARQQALASVEQMVDQHSPAIAKAVVDEHAELISLLLTDAALGHAFISLVELVPSSVDISDLVAGFEIVRIKPLFLPGAGPLGNENPTLVVAASLAAERSELWGFFWRCLAVGAICLGIIAIILYFVLDQVMIRPIVELDDYARKARLGQPKPLSVLKTRMRNGLYSVDALEDLTNEVSTMVRNLQKEIRDRQAAELQLQRSQRSLADAQRIAHVGSWTWDLTTDTVVCSDELYRIYGLARRDLESGFHRLAAAFDERDAKQVKNSVQLMIEGRGGLDETYRIRRPDGSIRWIQCRREVRRDNRGEAIAITGTALDITQRQCAEDALRTLNETLEARVAERTHQFYLINQELDAFAFSVSHDLRAPLRAIRNFSDILLESHSEAMDPMAIRYIQNINQSAADTEELIQGLLTLCQTSKGDFIREEIDLSEMARQITSRLREADRDRDVTVTIARHLIACANRDFMEVVLTNLLENAWKFTRHKASAQIEFGQERGTEVPTFFVRDNGVGFDMRYAVHLFKPFQRLHPSSKFEGNGIGLATVNRIVNRHGGEMRGEGAVGVGATFFFTIPDDTRLGESANAGDNAKQALG